MYRPLKSTLNFHNSFLTSTFARLDSSRLAVDHLDRSCLSPFTLNFLNLPVEVRPIVQATFQTSFLHFQQNLLSNPFPLVCLPTQQKP